MSLHTQGIAQTDLYGNIEDENKSRPWRFLDGSSLQSMPEVLRVHLFATVPLRLLWAGIPELDAAHRRLFRRCDMSVRALLFPVPTAVRARPTALYGDLGLGH